MPSRISVVVPVYNTGDGLVPCIESILNNTYSNIEVIMVDDGSTDGTSDICDELADKYENVKVVHTENRGVSAARNTGIENATGEYILFSDSDDYIPSDALEKLFNALSENGADMSAGIIRAHKANGEFAYYASEAGVLSDSESVMKKAGEHLFYSADAKLFTRELIGDTRFVEGKKINEDGFFVFECLIKCKKLAVIDDVVYEYLYNPGSASKSGFSEKFYDVLYFRDQKEKILEEKFPELIELRNEICLQHEMSFANKLVNADKQTIKKEYANICKQIRKRSKYLNVFSGITRIRAMMLCYVPGIYRVVLRLVRKKRK